MALDKDKFADVAPENPDTGKSGEKQADAAVVLAQTRGPRRFALILEFLNTPLPGEMKAAKALQSLLNNDLRFDQNIAERSAATHRRFLRYIHTSIREAVSRPKVLEMLDAVVVRELENLLRELEQKSSPLGGGKQAAIIAAAIDCIKTEEKLVGASRIGAYLEQVDLGRLIALDDRDGHTRDREYLEIGARLSDWALSRMGEEEQEFIATIVDDFLRNLAERPILQPHSSDTEGPEWQAHRKAIDEGKVSALEVLELLNDCDHALITKAFTSMQQKYLPILYSMLELLDAHTNFISRKVHLLKHFDFATEDIPLEVERIFGQAASNEEIEEVPRGKTRNPFEIFCSELNRANCSYAKLLQNRVVQLLLWQHYCSGPSAEGATVEERLKIVDSDAIRWLTVASS